MKTAQDYINEMESCNALMNPNLTFNEYVEQIKVFQDAVCKMITGDAYHSGMRIDEALFHLESAARKRMVQNDPTVLRAFQTLRRLAKEIAILMSGATAENQVARTLEFMNRPNTTVYRNVYVTDGNDETELDGLVLTDSGAIVLEVKRVKSDLTLDESGRMVFSGSECYDHVPLGEKMANKREILKRYLEHTLAQKELDIPVYVDSYIVFCAPKQKFIHINDEYRKERYCFKSNLNRVLENHLGGANYSSTQLDQLNAVFADMASNVKRFDIGIDYDEVRKNLADAMEVIEGATVEEEQSMNEGTSKMRVAAKPSVPTVLPNSFAKSRKDSWKYAAASVAVVVLAAGSVLLGFGSQRI